MKINRVEINRLRGHVLALTLPTCGVVAGANGSGKTTIADAIHLCTEGRIPRFKTCPKGLLDTEVCYEATDSSGRWSVKAVDSEGGESSFTFESYRNVRTLATSFSGGRTNADHLEAMAKRYVDRHGAGMAFIDADAVRSLSGADLERIVLELCGPRSQWDRGKVVAAIGAEAFGLAGRDDLEWAGVRGKGDLAELLRDAMTRHGGEDALDVRSTLGTARDAAAELASSAASDVRTLGRLLEEELPEALTEEQIRAYRAAAETEDAAVRARVDVVAQFAAEWSAAREAHSRALGEWQGSRERLVEQAQNETERFEIALKAKWDHEAREKRIREELERQRAEVAATEEELAGKRTRTEERDRRREALEAAKRRSAEAARALEEHKAAEPPDAGEQLEAAKAAADQAVRDATKSHAGAQSLFDRCTANVARLESERRDLASGVCPKCGSKTAAALASVDDELEKARAGIEVARRSLALCQENLDSATTAADVAGRAVVEHLRERRHWTTRNGELDKALRAREAEQRGAQSAVDEAELQGNRYASAARARLEAARTAVAQLEEELAKVQAETAAIAGEHDEAERRMEAANRALDSGEGPPVSTWTQDHSANLEAQREALELARESAAAMRDALARQEERARARAKAIEERKATEGRHRVAQAWRAVWSAVGEAVVEVQRIVLASLLEPVVSPVNTLAKAYGFDLGTFRAELTVDGLEVGWTDSRGFSPLAALSSGHTVCTLALLVAVVHDLARSPLRILIVDNAECLDATNRARVGSVLRAIVAGGDLHQAVLLSADFSGWPGLEVVPMPAQDRRAGDAEAAA